MKPYAPKLSSSPFIFKWVFPAIWLGTVWVISAGVFTGSKGDIPLPLVFMPVLMTGMGLFFFKHFFWVLADAVYDEGDHLRVRKGSKEERIAFRNILNVASSRLTNPAHISIRLRRPCSLGDEIVFLPRRSGVFRLAFNPFARNPIAEDLILRVDAARRQG